MVASADSTAVCVVGIRPDIYGLCAFSWLQNATGKSRSRGKIGVFVGSVPRMPPRLMLGLRP